MLREEAFLKFSQSKQLEITKSDAERLFRIDDYVTGKARMAKIERFRIFASGNRQLANAIDFCAALVREQ